MFSEYRVYIAVIGSALIGLLLIILDVSFPGLNLSDLFRDSWGLRIFIFLVLWIIAPIFYGFFDDTRGVSNPRIGTFGAFMGNP